MEDNPVQTAAARRHRRVLWRGGGTGVARVGLRHQIVALRARCGLMANAESFFHQAWCQRTAFASSRAEGVAARRMNFERRAHVSMSTQRVSFSRANWLTGRNRLASWRWLV